MDFDGDGDSDFVDGLIAGGLWYGSPVIVILTAIYLVHIGVWPPWVLALGGTIAAAIVGLKILR